MRDAAHPSAPRAQGGRPVQLLWFVDSAWNAALAAAKQKDTQQAAVLFAASAELAAAHPSPDAAMLSRRKVHAPPGACWPACLPEISSLWTLHARRSSFEACTPPLSHTHAAATPQLAHTLAATAALEVYRSMPALPEALMLAQRHVADAKVAAAALAQQAQFQSDPDDASLSAYLLLVVRRPAAPAPARQPLSGAQTDPPRSRAPPCCRLPALLHASAPPLSQEFSAAAAQQDMPAMLSTLERAKALPHWKAKHFLKMAQEVKGAH
jgi:hypothetical protein